MKARVTKPALFIILFLIIGVAGCAPGNAGQLAMTPMIQATGDKKISLPSDETGDHSVTVFAAASLTGAFQEIGQSFEAANPGVSVNFNFAGSQILRTQIEQGAQVDVFACADHKNMDLVDGEGLVAAGSVMDFATNSLIVILPTNNPGHINSLEDLGKPGVKLVLADASVPAGIYARQVLENMGYDPLYGKDFSVRVLANVVSNETDVKQVVAKVDLGEADAGIVYTSDAVAAPELGSLAIPSRFNIIAKYPIAIVANATAPGLATKFVGYVTSPDGQAILTKWGFNPVIP